MTRLFAPAITLAAALVASTASAQTTVGSIDGTLEGRSVSYVIMDGEDAQTGWREVDGGIEITLDAYPADSPQSDDNRLLITFVAQTAARMPEMLAGAVTLTQMGEELTGVDDAIDLSLNSVEVQDDSLYVASNIRATLGQTDENVSVVAPSASNLSADIQATVIRSED